MGKLVYIASPYNNPNPATRANNYKLVSELAADMVSKGVTAFSPITYGHTLLDFKDMPTQVEFWWDFCITFLEHADALLVYQMPGWDKSAGVAKEIEFAIKHDIPITYMACGELPEKYIPYDAK